MVEKGKMFRGHSCLLSRTPCANVLKNDFAYYSKDISKNFPGVKRWACSNAKAYVGVAIKDKQGKPIGLICAFSTKTISLPPQVKQVLKILASRAASEIERKAYEDKLNEMSITDELTQLRNRRGFFMLSEHNLKQIKRNKTKAALFFIDLNDMKKINDEKGHVVGDRALVMTAKFLKKVFRESDIIARIGGDEFAVLAANISEENTIKLQERFHDVLFNYNRSKDKKFNLSVSIGVAYIDEQSTVGFDDLIKKADKAMYKQKRKIKKK